MTLDPALKRLSAAYVKLREQRRISRRQAADQAGVHVSVVCRIERGGDAYLSTWEKLFEGLGYYIDWSMIETSAEAVDLIDEERDARWVRQMEGLCSGKRRYY